MRNYLFLFMALFIGLSFAACNVTLYTPLNNSNQSSLENVDPFIFNVTSDNSTEINCSLNVYYMMFFPTEFFNGNVTNDTIVSWNINTSFIDGWYGWDITCEDSVIDYCESDFRQFRTYTPSEGCSECCTTTNQTITYGEAELPGFDLKSLLGMFLIAIALWGLFHYTIAVWPH